MEKTSSYLALHCVSSRDWSPVRALGEVSYWLVCLFFTTRSALFMRCWTSVSHTPSASFLNITLQVIVFTGFHPSLFAFCYLQCSSFLSFNSQLNSSSSKCNCNKAICSLNSCCQSNPVTFWAHLLTVTFVVGSHVFVSGPEPCGWSLDACHADILFWDIN